VASKFLEIRGLYRIFGPCTGVYQNDMKKLISFMGIFFVHFGHILYGLCINSYGFSVCVCWFRCASSVLVTLSTVQYQILIVNWYIRSKKQCMKRSILLQQMPVSVLESKLQKKCALLQEKSWMDEYVPTSMWIYLYKFSGNDVASTCCSAMSLCYYPDQMMVF